jgi:F-type H+-transporting ATPase subunit a
MTAFRKLGISLIISGLCVLGATFAQAQDNHEHPTTTEQTGHPASSTTKYADEKSHPSTGGHHEKPFSAGETAIHHIADGNAIHMWGETYFPLPCMLYAPDQGWTFTMSSAFHPHHHGNGTTAVDGYVLVGGNVRRVQDPGFPKGKVEVGEILEEEITENGKKKTAFYVLHNGAKYRLDRKTGFDGGIMGAGVSSFYDFSITRNVFTMLLSCLVVFLLFRAAANRASKSRGLAPKGIQNALEPFITFIRDEVAKPIIGHHYQKYMPYLLTAFFFILGLNLIGQLPIFPGSANVTGNISVTIVLALFTFFITNLSANKHYWEHTLWMPGVPAWLKIFILTPIEILGLFLKPFTLLLRLFANIAAGHIVIIAFVSLIFIFGKSGASLSGSITGVAASVPLTLFMMTMELLVAFLQAFIFTLLSATYISAAIEEPHHH